MARVLKLTCLVIVCMVAAATMAANAALSCGTVTSKLAPCINYLSKGGVVPPPCCAGVKGLNSLAQTTPDRQQACRCLQNAARSMGANFNAGRASGLPGACGVRVPYPISASTNCNSVK